MNKIAFGFMLLAMQGCSEAPSNPGQVCSSQQTYDTILDLLAEQVAQAHSLTPSVGDDVLASAGTKSSLARVASFRLPTVDEINKDTGKISCNAVMRVQVPPRYRDTIDTEGLEINAVNTDSVDLHIAYSIQKAADGSQDVITLAAGSALAKAALQGAIANVLNVRSANVPETPADAVEPASEGDFDALGNSEGDSSPDGMTSNPPPASMPDAGSGSSDDGTENAQELMM